MLLPRGPAGEARAITGMPHASGTKAPGATAKAIGSEAIPHSMVTEPCGMMVIAHGTITKARASGTKASGPVTRTNSTHIKAGAFAAKAIGTVPYHSALIVKTCGGKARRSRADAFCELKHQLRAAGSGSTARSARTRKGRRDQSGPEELESGGITNTRTR